MQAVKFVGQRQAIVREQARPVPQVGEVLIRMHVAAICGSDLHAYRHGRGNTPPGTWTPGHEPCGEIVESAPDVSTLRSGERVLVYHRIGCGRCLQCRTGSTNICQNRVAALGFGRDGADAEYLVVPADRCFHIPDSMSWDDAVIISCQAGTAYAPLRRLGASGRQSIVVLGLGPVGLCVTIIGRAMGARIIGVDPVSERRDLARRVGAEAVFDPGNPDAAADIRELTDGGADGLVETSGQPAAHAKIPEYLRVEGQAAIVGLGSTEPSVNPISFFGKQLTLFASNLYPEWMLPEIFSFVQQHRLPLASIITHRARLADAPEMFRLADTASTGKIVFAFD
jgi:propanol-preferring alcohol dehydrogenase